jgi:hypothetical protein
MSKSLSVLGAAAVVVLAAGQARADRPRIAVSGVSGENVSPELRDKIARAVAAGLAASGADVRTEPATVAYRVRGTVDVEGRNYRIRLEIVDAKTGEIVDSQEDHCDICTESEALETAGIGASALKAKVFKRRPSVMIGDVPVQAPPPPPPAAPPPPPPEKAAPAAVVSVAPASEPPPARTGRHRVAGVGGIVTGVLAGVVGAQLVAVDGKGDCNDGPGVECPNFYRTKAGGIALLTGGALAVIAGVIVVAGKF